MRSMFLATLILTLLLGSMGCGQGRDPENATDSELPAAPDTLILAVTDTIGVEMGDSCYVFGQLMKACHSTDGDVIVLDMQQARLCVYSPEGVFSGYIGAPGPGPGEFQVPVGFAVFPEGGVVVTDAISRVLSFFDGEGGYTDMMSGFFPTPPIRIEGAPGSAIIGLHMPMVMIGETMEMSMELALKYAQKIGRSFDSQKILEIKLLAYERGEKLMRKKAQELEDAGKLQEAQNAAQLAETYSNEARMIKYTTG